MFRRYFWLKKDLNILFKIKPANLSSICPPTLASGSGNGNISQSLQFWFDMVQGFGFYSILSLGPDLYLDRTGPQSSENQNLEPHDQTAKIFTYRLTLGGSWIPVRKRINEIRLCHNTFDSGTTVSDRCLTDTTKRTSKRALIKKRFHFKKIKNFLKRKFGKFSKN